MVGVGGRPFCTGPLGHHGDVARPRRKASAVPLVVAGVAAAATARWLLRNRAVHPAVLGARTPGRGGNSPGTSGPGRTETTSRAPRSQALPLTHLDDVIVYGLRGIDGALIRWHNDSAEYHAADRIEHAADRIEHAADRIEPAADRIPRTGAPQA